MYACVIRTRHIPQDEHRQRALREELDEVRREWGSRVPLVVSLFYYYESGYYEQYSY